MYRERIEFLPSKNLPSFSILFATNLWRSSPAQTGQTNIEIITQTEAPMSIVDNLLCAMSTISSTLKPDIDTKQNVNMKINIP